MHNLFDFETRVEIVQKSFVYIVHAIFTILGEKQTYNVKVWFESCFHTVCNGTTPSLIRPSYTELQDAILVN